VAAGFDVVGVDLFDQPRYPFEFHQGDAVAFLREHGHEFDAVHASPPCQRFSKAQRIMKNDHPDLIGPTREVLLELGVPYVIENVEDARPELIDPVTLCGASFGLHTYRHRLFESSFPCLYSDARAARGEGRALAA
jgi:DNA (cytosine-5)-methyltransferase 1